MFEDIENGEKIKMFKTDFSGISIDTPEDLIKAEEYLNSHERSHSPNFF